jgi:hypothetical protein
MSSHLSRRVWLRWLAIVVPAGLALGLLSSYLYIAKPWQDSGVAMCATFRDIQERKPVDLTGASIPSWRAKFAGSRYGDLRRAGTSFIDQGAQLAAAGHANVGIAILSAPAVVSSYATLVGACGAHGVTLPPTLAGA